MFKLLIIIFFSTYGRFTWKSFLKEKGIPSEKIDKIKDQKAKCFFIYVFITLISNHIIWAQHMGCGVPFRGALYKDIRQSWNSKETKYEIKWFFIKWQLTASSILTNPKTHPTCLNAKMFMTTKFILKLYQFNDCRTAHKWFYTMSTRCKSL